MIFFPTQYYTLIGALPALPRSFEQVDRVPISPLKLDERLKMLEPQDARVLDEMSNFLVWERQPLEQTDEAILGRYNQFKLEVANRFASELISQTMEIRTIFAGLRCRRLQLDPPLGVAPIAAQIAKNWMHPDFRLGTQYPWISEVDKQLNGDAPFDLERMRIEFLWRRLHRLAEDHFNSFEAVVLYLMRWELVYRWTQRNAEVGQKKFERLVNDTMGEFANIFG